MSKTQESENPDFQALFEAAPGAYLILSPDLQIIAVSDQYLTATMTERKVILGRYLFEVFPDNPNDTGATGTNNLKASLERVIENKKSDPMAIQKYDIKRPNGSFEVRYWSPINSPVLNSEKKISYIIHSVEDVTDFVKLKQDRLKQSELNDDLLERLQQTDKIKQTQRMEAMGKLAGGISHDFNNMLAIIIMNCELMLDQKNIDPLTVKSFQQIKSTAEKAAKLTRKLLAFSSKQVSQPKVLNINTVVHEIQEILSGLTGKDVDIELNLDNKLGNIIADPTQIEQILINLIVNARDALPQGGKIYIETKNVTLDVNQSKGNPTTNPGDYVMLSVADTGVGMDAITQARIFEPFFTTKSLGKGSGLGLATIYGIVSQNKGTIWVYSEVQKGSVFKIYLPIVETAFVQPKQSKVTVKFAKKNASILVIDDEDELRNLLKEILISNNYRVKVAANGAAALSLIESETFDLIISDVMMPVMGGAQLREELETRGLKPKILFLSGYSEQTLFDHFNENQVQFLEKPFSTASLLEKIALSLSC